MRKKVIVIGLLLISMIFLVYKNNKRSISVNMIGVYWGAFDPPTQAHVAIVSASLKNIPLKKLFVVVNNHHYKDYAYPLTTRLHMIEQMLQGVQNVEVLWQDDTQKIDYAVLKTMTQDPLCAIAGYDAYQRWIKFSSVQERTLYDAIAVIPRGDERPLLYDENAFLLPIHVAYKYVSSTKARTEI